MTASLSPERHLQDEQDRLRLACLDTLARAPGQALNLLQLASQLGMPSRQALSDLCTSLPEWLELEGDRAILRARPDWLEEQAIAAAVGEVETSYQLILPFRTGSTNQDVLDRLSLEPDSTDLDFLACLTETQTAGRGRRGRQWHAGLANALLCSLGWYQRSPSPYLGLIPLVMGLAVAQVLREETDKALSESIRVKWPNDVYVGDAKLAGLLVESKPMSGGAGMAVVVGLGLNLRVETAHIPDPNQATTSLHRLMPALPDRNWLAGRILRTFMQAQQQVLEGGFAPFATAWEALDYLKDRPVTLMLGEQQIQGQAKGISEDGNLLVETNTGLRAFHCGEVSVRRRF